MIKNTRLNVLLIRLSILLFRAVLPLASLVAICTFTTLLFVTFTPEHSISLAPSTKIILVVVCAVTVTEPLFYAAVYVPWARYLSERTVPCEGSDLDRVERGALARKLLGEVDDLRFWVGMWCCAGASVGNASRSAVREWLAWGILNRYELVTADEGVQAELDGYLALVEEGLGREGVSLGDDDEHAPGGKGGEGRGGKSIRVTIDPMRVLHRPLLYYIFGVGLIDFFLFIKMWRMGFQHFPIRTNFQSFPWRPLSAFAKERSPSRLSYWYRAHTSKTRLPILYIHGIGVGLITYTDFLAELIAKNTDDDNGQVGILAVEIMPVSFRLTSPIPPSEVLARQLQQILQQHGWDKTKFVLAANSYGTIIATYLLRCADVAPHIGPMVLIDPVTLWAHMGDVAYNFTVKQPRSASEWQLWYFACTDIMAAHTVTRRFMWRENVLWRDEIEARKVGVVLSGADIILDAARLRRYLVGGREGSGFDGVKGTEMIRLDREGIGRDWEVLWFEDLNHAEVFEEMTERRLLVEMVWRYCLLE